METITYKLLEVFLAEYDLYFLPMNRVKQLQNSFGFFLHTNEKGVELFARQDLVVEYNSYLTPCELFEKLKEEGVIDFWFALDDDTRHLIYLNETYKEKFIKVCAIEDHYLIPIFIV